MAEEKFISIEYKTWEEKYKPMEEENRRLSLEYENLLESRTVYIQKGIRTHYDIRGRYQFISVDIKAEGAKLLLSPDDLSEFCNNIMREINSEYAGYGYKSAFWTQQKIKELEEAEARIKTIENKVSNIPWIIRFIFGIK